MGRWRGIYPVDLINKQMYLVLSFEASFDFVLTRLRLTVEA